MKNGVLAQCTPVALQATFFLIYVDTQARASVLKALGKFYISLWITFELEFS